MKLTLATTLALGILAAAVPAFAQNQAVPVHKLPVMTGSAGPSKEVKSGSLFSYPVTATDKDTWNIAASGFPANLTEIPDFDVTLTCKAMRSMSSYVTAKRGTEPDGTTTWDISGTAMIVTAPAFKIDDFEVVNNSSSPIKDIKVTFSQTILISLVQQPGGGA
jgi:zona occludens toxin (predicted ATPase)